MERARRHDLIWFPILIDTGSPDHRITRKSNYLQKSGLVIATGKGMISLKLFNTLIKDLGTVLLKIGVYLSGDELSDILDGFSRELWVGCKGATVNDRPVDLNKLLGMTCLDESSLIELRVQFGG